MLMLIPDMFIVKSADLILIERGRLARPGNDFS
jgi:hypothetical protein